MRHTCKLETVSLARVTIPVATVCKHHAVPDTRRLWIRGSPKYGIIVNYLLGVVAVARS